MKDCFERDSSSGRAPERAASVDGLLDDTILGVRTPAPEIETSNALQNRTLISEMETGACKIREALRAGAFSAAVEMQAAVVNAADKMNTGSLQNDLDFLAGRRKLAASAEQKRLIDQSLEDLRVLMASPFIERARMAAFLLKDGKVFQAEAKLDESLKVQIPSATADSDYVRQLRNDAAKQVQRLKVENNLLEEFESKLPQMDVSPRDGVLNREELLRAKSANLDPSFTALAEFLSDNYEYLTRRQWFFRLKEGISRSDIADYVKERAGKINDFRF